MPGLFCSSGCSGCGGSVGACPYCNSTVLVADCSARTIDQYPRDLGSSLGSLIGDSLQLAQIVEQMRAGNKIEAIRIYRGSYGVDLHTAKTAVENLAAGRPVPETAALPNSASKNTSAGSRPALSLR